MQSYIRIRILQSIITLFILSIIIFGVMRLSGDPALLMMHETSTEEDYQNIRAQLGLDKPIYLQYVIFFANALKGDFGESIRTRRKVIESIREGLPNTLKLVGVSSLFALILGLPLGVMSAVKKDTYIDIFARVAAGLGQSLPIFWVGLMLLHVFVVKLGVLPAAGMESWKHYLMPGFCLGFFVMAGIVRLLRSTMLEVLDNEYIRMARIKGVSERIVIWKHAFRNGLLPVVSFGGMYVAVLVTGTVLIESVFAWPGFGRLGYIGILQQDFPLVQGVVLTAGAMVMITNLVTDILYAYLDPRIRYRA